jgi:hypothetical protein
MGNCFKLIRIMVLLVIGFQQLSASQLHNKLGILKRTEKKWSIGDLIPGNSPVANSQQVVLNDQVDCGAIGNSSAKEQARVIHPWDKKDLSSKELALKNNHEINNRV